MSLWHWSLLKRTILLSLFLLPGGELAVHSHHAPPPKPVALVSDTVPTLPVDDPQPASRSRPLVIEPEPTVTVTVTPTTTPQLPAPVVPVADSSGCTSANWKSTMSADLIWLDTHESNMNPMAVNPSSGAFGLGQLLVGTRTYDPCVQLREQRVYITSRYGSEANAVAFWRAHYYY